MLCDFQCVFRKLLSCSCSRPPQAQTKGQLEILFIIIVYSVAQCSNNQQSISISQFSQIFNFTNSSEQSQNSWGSYAATGSEITEKVKLLSNTHNDVTY